MAAAGTSVQGRSDALARLQARDLAIDEALSAILVAASLNEPHSEHTYRLLADALKRLGAAVDARSHRILDAVRHLIHANELAKGRAIVGRCRVAQAEAGPPPAHVDGVDLFLEPLHGLVALDTSGRRWHSVDDDPQFGFGELCRYAGQWVELTVGLAFQQEPNCSPLIHIDRGEGMSESGALSLPRPAPHSGLSTIVFAVPGEIRYARFDPCAAAIAFTLTTFRIRRISRIDAMREMVRTMRHSGQLRRLRNTYAPQWKTLRSPAARRLLKDAFVDAYRTALTARSYAYSEWIVRFEPHADTYPRLAAQRSEWDRQPTISVLMPTYDTPTRYLREAIESVQRQEYPHWELCIADDASKAPHVRQVLAEYAAGDARIRVCYRPDNGHISAASNSALALATGEFVALLDHDDRLHPLALHYVAEAIVGTPGVAMIYSDEDKVDTAGLRNGPYFKSDFNYELFLAQNMVSHLGCYATETVRALGGFRVGLEGSQDWDLGLRVFEQVGAAAIVHIPRVLYHWRELPGSTAVSVNEKPYAWVAGRRAVEEHVRRRSIDATVLPAPGLPSWNRIRYAVPSPAPKVSIVIPTRDKVFLLRNCIASILEKTTYPNYEIVIVDNGSVEADTENYLRSLPTDRIRVLRDDAPFNYSRLNNRAVEASSGELVCLLNNDIEVVTPDWLEEMVGIVSQGSVGIVGARLWYPDQRIQHAGVILGIGGIASHSHRFAPRGNPGYFGRAVLHQQLSAVTGACLLVSRKLWDTLDGLDETLAVAFNDVDFCLRAGALGRRVVWTPYAELIHHESISRGPENTPEKIERFEAEQALMRQRWGELIKADPFYSPNLTLLAEDFSLAWESRT